MGQFIRVNGDYNIKTADGAKIVFDTGPALAGGEVLITGNLVVAGESTTVAAENLKVRDNVIVLNDGETGAGVTLDYSGIQIDRGVDLPASLFWNENILPPQWRIDTSDLSAKNGGWQFVAGGEGSNDFSNSRIKLREILTDGTIQTEYISELDVPGGRFGDLNLIGKGNGVVTVFGTSNYEDQVKHDDDIPNKLYVDNSILNNPTFQILRDNTRVIVADKDVVSGEPGSVAYLTANTGHSTKDGLSAVSVVVDTELTAQFYQDRLLIWNGQSGVTGLEIDGINFEIRTEPSVTDQDIFIRTDNVGIPSSDGSTTGTGKLRTNVALKLDKTANSLTYESGFTLVHAKEPGLGASGVWFSNDSPEERKYHRYGELISKNKALVFSMIF